MDKTDGQTSLLNPWQNAAHIAQILSQQGAELIIAIGADQWCEKCALLRPKFEQLAMQTAAHRVCLWFDLEEHAEFIGNFIPEDLPFLTRWQRGQCIQSAVITSIDLDQSTPITLRSVPIPPDLTNMWQVLAQPNWGS